MSASPSCTPPPLVGVSEVPGRGRALVASRRILPGEVVLADSPLLLYPSSLASLSAYCSRCFRSLSSAAPPPPLRCPACSLALFCPSCSPSHPVLLCRALPLLLPSETSSSPSPSPDLVPSLLFLLSAYSLPSPSLLRLLSLSASASASASPEALALHSLLCSLRLPRDLLPGSFSPDLTAALLARDKTNAFALMEPSAAAPAQARGVRAYGIYPDAAFFNHDCLPNACRFDYVDAPGDRNADLTVRALHEIPQGREVCVSYFPANWSYKERQRRLLDDYGFRCDCDRCRVESQWRENGRDQADDEDGGGEERMEEGEGAAEEEEEGEEMEAEDEEAEDGDGDFPHAYFFVKFLCDRESCGGTLAPLPPSADGALSNVLECNVCGQLRKEEEQLGGDSIGDMLDE